MSGISERLSKVLADRYRVERELGAGGMATVYLAQDLKHDRKVAIKVLRTELAQVLGADRFIQEIKTIAHLQHPNILPLFDSGVIPGRPDGQSAGRQESAEVPYYVMPYIEGESLHARIAREGKLSNADATRIFREVADALSYAHRHGVVHRDIKPDNILLSENHAIVADFGVAKAVSASVTSGGGLTTVGMVIGTPAYMAPEQAAGDPTLDHRADIYALGALGYEMLTGQEMFPGRTPQAVIAAHITESPVPLARRAPGCPPALAALITRCLEKDPARRPQNASEILAALDSAIPTGPGRPRWLLWGVAAAAIVLVIAGLFAAGVIGGRSLLAQGVLEARDPILVADVTNRTRDSLLGLTVTEALRVDLTQSRAVALVSPGDIQKALARMGRATDLPLDPTLAREVAQRQGYKAYVTGEIGTAGTGFVISAQLVSTANGEVLAAVRETARDSTGIIEAIGQVSRQLRRKIGESLRNVSSDRPLEQVTTPSLDALRKYSLATQLTNTVGDFDRADALLEEAVAIDTGFAMAWRKLGVNLGNAGGQRSRARQAIEKAYAHRDRLTELERYMTMGTYFTRVQQDPERALAAYQSALDIDPRYMGAINNMGLIYGQLKDQAHAEEAYRRAIGIDSNSAIALFNLYEVLVQEGKLDQADSTVSIATRRFPAHDNTPYARWSLAYNRGDEATMRRVVQSFRDSAGADRGNHAFASVMLAELGLLHGKLREGEGFIRDAIQDGQSRGSKRRVLQNSLWLGGIDVWYRGDRVGGLRKMDAALARFPLSQMDTLDRPYLDLAYGYAMAGRPDRARAYLAEFEKIDPSLRANDEGYRISVHGMVTLSEGHADAAIHEMQAGMALDPCLYCGLPDLGRAFTAAGQPDSAIAAYERYLSLHSPDKIDFDNYELPVMYRQLGELYEKKGDRTRALDYYGRFVELWRDADPDLQPQVAEIRQRMAGLASEEGGNRR